MTDQLPVAGMRRFQHVRNTRSGTIGVLAEDVVFTIKPFDKVRVSVGFDTRRWTANSIEAYRRLPVPVEGVDGLLASPPRRMAPVTDPQVARAQLLNLLRALDRDEWLAS